VPSGHRRGDDRICASVLRPDKETIRFSQRVTGRPVTVKNVDLLDRGHQSARADAFAFAGEPSAGEDDFFSEGENVVEATSISRLYRVRVDQW
jgi:hypothetical protein